MPAVLTALSCVLTWSMLVSGCGDSQKGRLAPPFSAKDRNGKDFNLGDLKGKAVILYFWSTWAPPSRLGISQMVRVQSEYRKRNLAVVGVAIRDELKPVNRFLKEVPVNFQVVLGSTVMEDSYFGGEGVKLPMILLLDGKGVIRERFTGYQAKDDLAPVIEQMVDLTK